MIVKIVWRRSSKIIPHLREQFKAMLAIVEDAEGNVEKADEAEWLVIEQVRQLGSELLHGWANSKMSQKTKEKRSEGNATGNGKKTHVAHDVWGNNSI